MFLLLLLLLAAGIWGWTSKPWEQWEFFTGDAENTVIIDRYDRVLDEYVSLNSYTALRQMNTQYPMQTKMLIEDVLELGYVDEPNVEQRLRSFYLDSTVQIILDEVHRQYGDMSDIEEAFEEAFERQREKDPNFRTPHVYTLISCLHQSIVVTDTLIGISLDKYLGEDFPLYNKYYTREQRAQMNRNAIVGDAIQAYLHYTKNEP